jgi:hypothetical protein
MDEMPGGMDELRESAVSALRDPAEIPGTRRLGKKSAELQVWRLSMREAWRSWTVYQQWKDDECSGLVRRVLWDQAADERRLADPVAGLIEGVPTQPTLSVADVAIPWSEVSLWVEQFAYLQISPFLQNPVEPDGSSNGVKVWPAGFEIDWPGGGPEEWKPVVCLADKIIGRVEELFKGQPND